MITAVVCFFLAVLWFGVVIADGVHQGEYPWPPRRRHRSRRLHRPHLPRRAGRLTAEDAETIAWARSLRRTWARDAAAARIADLDVQPAVIPPTETPEHDPGPQLDYADTGTGWAELRELAAMLAADWGE